jgi:hypothetical protein
MAGVLAEPALWTVLFHGETAPWQDADPAEAFGFGQPVVRRTAWTLLQTLVRHAKGLCSTPSRVASPNIQQTG